MKSKLNTLLLLNTKLQYFIFVFLLLMLWFGALEYRDLFNPDEARYAEIPREMIVSGDWITPRLNGLKYFEKPALQYWITATTYELLGEDEWTARLWPALSGFLTLILVYATTRRLLNKQAGINAALILASTFQFFLFSQALTLDMGLTFFLTLTLCAFITAFDIRLTNYQRSIAMLTVWLSIAMAILSKGLIGIVLPALVLLSYVVIHREWHLIGKLEWTYGSLLMLTIVCPWFIIMEIRNPGFSQFFFIHEHFARYALNEHKRSGGWYYFLAVFLAGSLPWSLTYITAWKNAWRLEDPKTVELHPWRLLMLWITVIMLFYSISSSKLPGYILPIFPALAILSSCYIRNCKTSLSRQYILGLSAIVAFIAISLPIFIYRSKFAHTLAITQNYVPLVAIVMGLLSILLFLTWLFYERSQRIVFIITAFSSILAFQTIIMGSQNVVDQFSTETLFKQAERKVGDFPKHDSFYSVGMYDQTIPLQLDRPVTIVAYQDEFSMGISLEPRLGISTLEEFSNRWAAETQAYAIMTRQSFDRAYLLKMPMVILSANNKTVIVARRPVVKLIKSRPEHLG